MTPEEIIYGNVIKKTKAKLPNPKEIGTKYYACPCFVPEAFPSINAFKMITFKKVTLCNGELSWEFDSIDN